MKATELAAIVDNFTTNYLYSDANSEVRFGCECGCGGDSYTPETWDNMMAAYSESYDEYKAYCEEAGIEWDY